MANLVKYNVLDENGLDQLLREIAKAIKESYVNTSTYESGLAKKQDKLTIDSTLSTSSTNPIQNKTVKTALDKKANNTVVTTTANGLMSAKDKETFDLNVLSQGDMEELSAILDE